MTGWLMGWPALREALVRRKGSLSSDKRSVSFHIEGMILTFNGTDNFVEGLDGKDHERILVTVNGEPIDLSQWLHDETPILMTGKDVVKDRNGTKKYCYMICDKIIEEIKYLEVL